jgi:hypothetical protein
VNRTVIVSGSVFYRSDHRSGPNNYGGDASGHDGTRSEGLGCGRACIGELNLLGDRASALRAGVDAPFFLFLLAMTLSVARVDDDFFVRRDGRGIGGVGLRRCGQRWRHGGHFSLGMTVGGGDLAAMETGVREWHAMEMGLQTSAGFCGFCRLSPCTRGWPASIHNRKIGSLLLSSGPFFGAI